MARIASIKTDKTKYDMVFAFEYNANIINDIRTFNYRWWNPNDKTWQIEIHLDNIKELINLCNKYSFDLTFNKQDLKNILLEEKEKILADRKANSFEFPKNSNYLVYAKRTAEHRIFLHFDYSPSITDEIKEIPGAKFIKNSRRTGWEIDIDFKNMPAVLRYIKQPYVYCSDPTLITYLENIINSSKILSKKSRSASTENDLIIDGLAHNLRDFQKVGVDYALQTKKLFIADDMGCISSDALVCVKKLDSVKKMNLCTLYRDYKNSLNSAEFEILGMNEDSCQSKFSPILDVIYSGAKEVYMVALDNITAVKATLDHEFLTPHGYAPLKELCIGDILYSFTDYDANITIPTAKIVSINKVGITDVYDIKVASKFHNFIADGIVVHNCGKTIEALATFQASKYPSCLIVCPNAVKYNWLAEANKWLPGRKAVVLDIDKKTDSLKQIDDINIINYDKLTKIWPYLNTANIKFAIFDESHRLIYAKTKWSKTALEISQNLDYCLLLSGTPIVNRPSDLINQLKVIDKLALFGGDWKFKQRYCDLRMGRFGWEYKGATHLDELHEILRSTCYIRRMKKQVIKDLPSKQRSYIPVVLNPKERKEYTEAEKDIVKWIINNKEEIKKFYALLKEERLKNEGYFEYLTRLKVRKAETLIKISKLRRLAAKAKIEHIVNWSEDFMHTGKKLVIFAFHKEIIEKLENSLRQYGVVIINGDIDAIRKQQNVESFQNDPNTRIIICNLKAGGVGITLTAASDVVFIEYGWCLSDHIQAEDRCYRIGQTNAVNIWYFFADDTIDLDMISMLQEKEKVINAVVDGIDDTDDSIVENSIKNLLAKYKKNF